MKTTQTPTIDAIFARDDHYEDRTTQVSGIARGLEIALRDCINLMWARGANVSGESYPDLETVRSGLLPQERAVFDRARKALVI